MLAALARHAVYGVTTQGALSLERFNMPPAGGCCRAVLAVIGTAVPAATLQPPAALQETTAPPAPYPKSRAAQGSTARWAPVHAPHARPGHTLQLPGKAPARPALQATTPPPLASPPASPARPAMRASTTTSAQLQRRATATRSAPTRRPSPICAGPRAPRTPARGTPGRRSRPGGRGGRS